MRLAVLLPAQLIYDGVSYTTPSYFLYQLVELRRHLDRLDLIAFVRHSTTARASEPVDSERLTIVPLPDPKTGLALHSYRLPAILRRLREIFQTSSSGWNAVMLYEAGVVSFVTWWLCRRRHIPTILFVGGRVDLGITSLKRNQHLVRRQLARMLSGWYRFSLRTLSARTPTVVTGSSLRDALAREGVPIHNLFASTMHESEIDAQAPETRDYVQGTLSMVTVCRIVPIKGLEHLLRALAQARNAGLRVRWSLVGPVQDAEYAVRLKTLVKDLALEPNVEFVGAIPHGPELTALYRSADCFVLPSLSEGTPKVLPEALAAGLPVIASNVGGIPEVLGETESIPGLLVPPGDEVALAEAIASLARDTSKRRELARYAIARAEFLTTERQMAALYGFIASVVNNQQSPRQSFPGDGSHAR